MIETSNRPTRRHPPDHTLIIPTRNRPDLLRQNLAFLQSQGLTSHILVLDSSDAPDLAINVRTLGESRLHSEHVVYDPATPVYDKFVNGTGRASTPFASFLADDDLLFVDGLNHSLDLLRRERDVEIAHGFYFTFDFAANRNDLDLTIMLYAAPSLDEDAPLRRLQALMRTYQALCYGVFRTPILLEAYRRVAQARSLLFSELLSSVFPLLAGKAIRLPVIYMARRHAQPSEGLRKRWHPLEWFMRDANDLLSEYASYKSVLLAALETHGVPVSAHVRRIVDLIHFDYLRAHVPSSAVEILMRMEESRRDIDQYWTDPALQQSLLVAHNDGLPEPLDRLTSRIADAFPGQVDPASGDVATWPLVSVSPVRSYRFQKTFLDNRLSSLLPLKGEDIRNLVATLDALGSLA